VPGLGDSSGGGETPEYEEKAKKRGKEPDCFSGWRTSSRRYLKVGAGGWTGEAVTPPFPDVTGSSSPLNSIEEERGPSEARGKIAKQMYTNGEK